MIEKYTVNIGNLKVSGPAEDIHKLACVYSFAACEYGHQIVKEIHGKHCDTLIAELKAEKKEIENIEKQLIDVIRNSDYYKKHTYKMSHLIDDVLNEIEADER